MSWDDDKPLPEDEEIAQAFPTRSGRHDTYAEARRMVGAKRSKGALVSLVNWLLVRLHEAQPESATPMPCADERPYSIDVGGFAPGGEMPRPHSVEVAAPGSGAERAFRDGWNAVFASMRGDEGCSNTVEDAWRRRSSGFTRKAGEP